MPQSNESEPRDSRSDRRSFCLQGGCAALGALFCPSWTDAVRSGGPSKTLNTSKEEIAMQGKITGVTVKVQSIKGTCGAGYKVGDTARITENGVEGKICIHALYSMLPAAFALLYDARFPWLENPEVKTHACPDAANPVVFELTRNRE